MKRKAKKTLALLLGIMMLISAFIVPVGATDKKVDAGSSSTKASTSMSDVQEVLSTPSYADYRKKYASIAKGDGTYVIDALDYDKSKTTAIVEQKEGYYGKDGCLITPEVGSVTWKVNIEKEGFYVIELEYCQIEGKTSEIERIFSLNGSVPFSESRSIVLNKVWTYDYVIGKDGKPTFKTDITGNDIRPSVSESPEWINYVIHDSYGYYSDPLQFYFKKGENEITLESSREQVAIKSITIRPYEEPITYEDYKKIYGDPEKNRPSSAASIKIEAENAGKVSHVTMYPVYDRTSPITSGLTGMQSAKMTKYNTFGKEQWQNVGEWVEYEIDVAEDGYYSIAFRYKQSLLSGMYVSRKVYIDGEVPFVEAASCRFGYTDKWDIKYLGSDGTEYEFYLTKGKHTIRFEATLGDMGEQIQKVNESLSNINSCYLEIIKLTGSTPDKNRTYGFSRVMPNVLKTMMIESSNLQATYDYLVEKVGRGEKTSTIEQVKNILYTMASDEKEIAAKLETLKSYIGTLGTWITSAKTQPLQVDYILIQSKNEALPKKEANFFESLWYEIKLFFSSFTTDYSSFGVSDTAGEARTVEVWLESGTDKGRDQALIIRNLIDNKFTPESGISANLKLVSAGTLLPSVLAGVGPDVSLFAASTTVIDYALRNAAVPLNDFIEKDSEDVLARFPDAAMIPLTLYNYDVDTDTTSKTYYALPDSLTFAMMFYRKDILADLGLEVPKTWDDLLAMIPILQYNNMEIGISNDIYTFIYQSGYEAYADHGMRINFDSTGVLGAFTKLCNMYTQYSLPYQYDFSNRFRTGEMPIGITTYTACNQLSIFASELSGLWTFVPLPGYEVVDEDGNTTINNSAIATVTGCIMLNGCEDKDAAWEFMKWYTAKDFQVSYSNEIVSIVGIASRPATANSEALADLPWTAEEVNNIIAQFENLTAVPNHPGSYYLARYVNFAFLAAYNDGKDPADALLSYVTTINKEITRKRKEFGMDYLEIGQKLDDLKKKSDDKE